MPPNILILMAPSLAAVAGLSAIIESDTTKKSTSTSGVHSVKYFLFILPNAVFPLLSPK